jgi:hypothetical protein
MELDLTLAASTRGWAPSISGRPDPLEGVCLEKQPVMGEWPLQVRRTKNLQLV